MWRGRGFGFGRMGWGYGPGSGWGRANPMPYCRAYPWLPRGWWANPAYASWPNVGYGTPQWAPGAWNNWQGWGYGNTLAYRW